MGTTSIHAGPLRVDFVKAWVVEVAKPRDLLGSFDTREEAFRFACRRLGTFHAVRIRRRGETEGEVLA